MNGPSPSNRRLFFERPVADLFSSGNVHSHMKALLPRWFRLVFLFALSGILIPLILTGCSASSEPFSSLLENFHLVAGPAFSQRPFSFAEIEEIIIGLLLLAAIVSLSTQWLRIPYTVGLVIVGFILTFIGQIPVLSITPEILLVLLIPPLVFEAAFHLNFAELWRELPLVLTLAIPGVILTTILVGGMVYLSAGIALPFALVFGAIIAATDPVAVVALFRSLGVPRRLQVLLEGESLLNDGTAIVVFNLILATALTGKFDLGQSLLQFIYIAGGGILVGAVAGILVSQLIGKIDNYLVETTLTTVLAYGSYLVAEYVLGVSGVLAVVAAGLASGQIGPRGMSPTTRIVVFNFWEYIAFLANSFVFLIIGLQIDLHLLINNAIAILWGIVAVLISRAVVIYGLSSIGHVPIRWKNILFWGGLRGAISLALALSLATHTPHRDQLQAMTFGVVLFTLIVEGLSMRFLISRSGIGRLSAVQEQYQRSHARAIAMRAAQSRLKLLNREGLISDYTWRTLQPILDQRLQHTTEEVHIVLEQAPGLHEAELADAWRESLRTQRSAIAALYRDRIISEDVYTQLVADIDILLTDSESTWPELAEEHQPDEPANS